LHDVPFRVSTSDRIVVTVSNQSDRAEDHKILSDRRSELGGIAWLAKFSRPPVKLIKIVATARSDEHVFNLECGRATKAGPVALADGGLDGVGGSAGELAFAGRASGSAASRSSRPRRTSYAQSCTTGWRWSWPLMHGRLG
jgi:hypothetical protein